MTRTLLVPGLLLTLAGCPKPQGSPVLYDPAGTATEATGEPDGGTGDLTTGTAPGMGDEPGLTAAERRGSRVPAEERINDAASLLDSGSDTSVQRATRILEEVVSDEPDNAWGHFNLGVARYQGGNVNAARSAWVRAAQLDPALSEAWLYQGVIQERVGRYDLAITAYRNGLQRDPEDMKLREAIVGALRKQGRVEEAIVEAKDALAINANSLVVYNNLGLAYMDQGEYDLAKFVFMKARNSIIGADDNAYVHCNLGWILYLQDEVGQATFHLQKAVELDPELVPANIYLARVYLDNRNYGDMVPLLERALAKDPENHGVLMNLGIAYRGVGRMEESRAAYDKALEIQPGNPDPLFNLGILHGDYLKDYDASVDSFERYIEAGGAEAETAREYIKEVKKERKKAERKREAEAEKAAKEAEREERLRLIQEAEEEAARREAAGLPPMGAEEEEGTPDAEPPPAEPEAPPALFPGDDTPAEEPPPAAPPPAAPPAEEPPAEEPPAAPETAPEDDGATPWGDGGDSPWGTE